MYDLAVGDMQMQASEFERMTFGEFMCRYAGHLRGEEKHLHNTRLIMYSVFQKGTKRRYKLTDIFQLPMDTKRTAKADTMTKDQYEALKDKYKHLN